MNYRQKLGYTTLGAAMVLIVIGGGWALTQKWKGSQAVPVIRTVAAVEPPESKGEKIVVHVTGAVVRAGVYRLKDGMRIEDAIKLAGGVTENADIASVNFAKKCRDGMQIDVKVDKSKVKVELTPEEIRRNAEWELQIKRMGIINDHLIEQYRPRLSVKEIEKAEKEAELEAIRELEAARARSRWHNQRSKEIAEELARKKQLEDKQPQESESEEPNE